MSAKSKNEQAKGTILMEQRGVTPVITEVNYSNHKKEDCLECGHSERRDETRVFEESEGNYWAWFTVIGA